MIKKKGFVPFQVKGTIDSLTKNTPEDKKQDLINNLIGKTVNCNREYIARITNIDRKYGMWYGKVTKVL